MIEVKNLSFGYGNHLVLKDISFSFLKEDFVCLIGKNGVGKSSLLHCLGGVLKPDSGMITFMGKKISCWRPKELASHMALLARNPLYVRGLSAEDMIKMSEYAHRKKRQGLSFEQILRELDIKHLQKREMETLSSGEFQKVHLASVIYQNPKLLLLDEPLSFVDIRFRLEIKKFLKKLHRQYGITVMAIVHDLNDAYELASKIIALKTGKKFFDGTPEKFLKEKVGESLFDVDFEPFTNPSTGRQLWAVKQ